MKMLGQVGRVLLRRLQEPLHSLELNGQVLKLSNRYPRSLTCREELNHREYQDSQPLIYHRHPKRHQLSKHLPSPDP